MRYLLNPSRAEEKIESEGESEHIRLQTEMFVSENWINFLRE